MKIRYEEKSLYENKKRCFLQIWMEINLLFIDGKALEFEIEILERFKR